MKTSIRDCPTTEKPGTGWVAMINWKKHLPAGFAAKAAALLILILSLPLIQTGCATAGRGRRVVVESSEANAPEWVRRAPEANERYLYFVGRSTGAGSLEDAESDAAFNALRQIVTAIGVKASFSYERLRKTSELLLTDKLDISGSAVVKGLKRLETFHEKKTTTSGDSVKTTYNAHLLVRYPVLSMKTERVRLEQETETRVRLAGALLDKAGGLADGGEKEQAYLKAVEALELAMKPSVHASGATLAGLEGLRTKARETASSLGIELRKVLVEPVSTVTKPGGRASDDPGLTDALAGLLLKAGFEPEESMNNKSTAGVLTRAAATCRLEGSSSLGKEFFLSRWTVSVLLLDPRDGSILFSGVYPVKGFGPDAQRAALDARRRIRGEVFEKFAWAAKEKFDSMTVK